MMPKKNDELILSHLAEIGQSYKDYCSAQRVVESRLRDSQFAKEALRIYEWLANRRSYFWSQLWHLDTLEFTYALDHSTWASDSLALWGKTEPSWKERTCAN